MAQRVPDLLPPPEAFSAHSEDGEPTLIEILRVQGELLDKRTQGDVRGEIAATQGQPGLLSFWFVLYAPALEYRYRLFLVQHGIDTYPAELFRQRSERCGVAQNRAEFEDQVRGLLAEDRTMHLIRQMRQLIQEQREESGALSRINPGARGHLLAS